jgi:hypothetical protein
MNEILFCVFLVTLHGICRYGIIDVLKKINRIKK